MYNEDKFLKKSLLNVVGEIGQEIGSLMKLRIMQKNHVHYDLWEFIWKISYLTNK
jgi:hypothetical protein